MSETRDVRPSVVDRPGIEPRFSTSLDGGGAGLVLDLSDLPSQHHAAWIAYLRFALGTEAVKRRLYVSGSPSSGFAGNDVSYRSEAASAPRSDERFAYVSDACSLSRKLLRAFDRIYVSPRSALRLIDTGLYLELIARGPYRDGVLDIEKGELEPVARRVSLISSVFDGDRYLAGFLSNMASLAGYEQCEHFLIRPASPGNEHAALMAHVREHPGAVYINLERDPGLYGVWNLGARLSTARYLSNANLDDRRHPAHVRVLADILDADPTLAVVSSALRVTADAELSWDDSDSCEVLFGRDGDLRYGAEGLVQRRGDEDRARNLPHCMPLWRRSLHGRYGWFDEARWGPSADWEFWLRVARGGEGFRLVGETLGLHLRNPHSYWRRSGGGEERDARILAHHRTGGTPESKARRFDAALELLRGGSCAEAFEILHGHTFLVPEAGSSADRLHEYIDRHFFGVPEGGGDTNTEAWYWHPSAEESLFMHAVYLAHCVRVADESDRQRVRAVWRGLVADMVETGGDWKWAVLYALVLRLMGDREDELRLLRAMHAKDRVTFWVALQAVYRHTVALEELSAAIAGIRPVSAAEPASCADLAVTVYPAYSGNTYQSLLYREAVNAGAVVREAKTLEELIEVDPIPGKRNIIHLHWINAIFRDTNAASMGERAKEFLSLMEKRRAHGFEIRWTVHNRLSHECVDPIQEADFRRRLCAVSDYIYVHHPMVPDMLDWLPDTARLRLIEHGPYEVSADCPDQSSARDALGLSSGDFVVACIGRLRPYKGLTDTLRPLLGVLEKDPRMKLIIGGILQDKALSQTLGGVSSSRLIVREDRLSDRELETVMRASDCGLLSYREVLTSGALMHWAALGRPVLAPPIGTIPAYVVHGWNGLLYRTPEELATQVRRLLDAPRGALIRLGDNARRMSETLSWKFS